MPPPTENATEDLATLLELLKADETGERVSAALRAVRALTQDPQPFRNPVDDPVAVYQTHPRLALELSLDGILDFCTLREIVTVSRLSKEYRVRVQSYLVRRYNVLLSRWMKEPTAFRDVMRATGSIVSGSTALGFALGHGVNWASNDLDIYAPVGMPCQNIVNYLVSKEGYAIKPRPWALPAAPGTGVPPTPEDLDENYVLDAASFKITAVHKLVKTVAVPGTNEERELSIDVIEAMTNSAIGPIFRFHSTLVMNWLTADSIFMAYPRLTLEKRGIINPKLLRRQVVANRNAVWRVKYEKRGFAIAGDMGELKLGVPCKEACPLVLRSTLDQGCLDFGFTRSSTEATFAEVQWALCRDEAYVEMGQCKNPFCPRGNRMLRSRRGNALSASSRLGFAQLHSVTVEHYEVEDGE